ncbi:unnamed protein product [Adineta steineri]|uniref:Uncharacterized protein n=1 Tax=Adineta steineri TaxID=433720 RepID=A0A815BXC0_9BILA|nr:unnamed protein product [Adineta steineri]CAF1349994.1 unnamed protein product [Adineta steineri]CAF3658624.1 unnamed protein product [Adineta steineri]CAF3684997.1 unnamed protein product [Adineta steineri]
MVKKVNLFSSNQSKELIDLVGFNSFQSLDDCLGYPDCADGRAEWIEIRTRNQSKRIMFKNGNLIKDFEQIILQLTNLRNQYINDL